MPEDPPFRLDAPMFSCVSNAKDWPGEWAQYMFSAFFSNELFDLFNEPTEGRSGLPADLVSAVLQEYYAADEAGEHSMLSLPKPVVAACDQILRCCKALIAVADPTPGILGSRYQDVVDVFEGSGEESSQTENEALLLRVLNKSHEWKARLSSFYDDAKDDDHIATQYQQLQDEWQASGQQPSQEHVRQTLKLVKVWSPKVRAGGCNRHTAILKSNCCNPGPPHQHICKWFLFCIVRHLLQMGPVDQGAGRCVLFLLLPFVLLKLGHRFPCSFWEHDPAPGKAKQIELRLLRPGRSGWV